MTREALKKLNEKQMNYCKTLSALIDRAKIKGLKEARAGRRGVHTLYGRLCNIKPRQGTAA